MLRTLLTALLLQTLSALCQVPSYSFITSRRADTATYFFLQTFKMRKGSQHKGRQMIIDGTGHTVYYRITANASDFKYHSNGLMSFYGTSNKFYLMNQDFSIIDSVGTVNGATIDSHDFLILPNGHFILIGWEVQTKDLSTYKIFKQKTLFGSKRAQVRFHLIQELDADKKLVHEWRAAPHFQVQDADPWYRNDTLNMDAAHFNSVDVTTDGHYIISARYYQEVFKVDPRKNKIIWRFGGPYNNITLKGDTVPFLGQHDARLHAGNMLTLFDNGYAGPARQHPARALRYRINDSLRTAELLFSYSPSGNLVSESTGGLQLQNGSMLVNYGQVQNGMPNITFEVIDSAGKVRTSLRFADTLGTYRAYAFKTDFIRNRQPALLKQKTAGGWIIKPDRPAAEYQWNDGSIGSQLFVSKPGTYYVYLPIGSGGYISSRPITLHNADFK